MAAGEAQQGLKGPEPSEPSPQAAGGPPSIKPDRESQGGDWRG